MTLKGEQTIKPVRPNLGLTAEYRRRLEKAVDTMAKSVLFWVKARYRANPPELAEDASPAMDLRKAMRKLAGQWQRDFDELAPALAEFFAQSASDRHDRVLRKLLRDKGFTVKFKASAAQNDVYQSVIAENIALIKSIPAQYLTQVEGSVMRSVQTGRDLSTLAEELRVHHGVTARRAAFIARDQNNKATAAFTRARQDELGITEAIWVHSSGGKTPRPEHVAFDGHRYNIATGAYLEGKWTWPGVEPNCRCVPKSVIPGF